MINNNVVAETIGLIGNSKLLLSIRQTVTDLASNSKVINTIKLAAQKTLETGWFILFQTPNERASMLCTILQPLTSPNGMNLLMFKNNCYLFFFFKLFYLKYHLDDSQSISSNQEFMIDLITNSLLGDNILHTFLQKAIERKFKIKKKIFTHFLNILKKYLFFISCLNLNCFVTY